jgi:hypothetical protein
MSVEDLMRVVPPPASMKRAPHDWEMVEHRLGMQLPQDYKELISVYGEGCFDRFLWTYSPFSANKFLNLLDRSQAVLSAFATLKKNPNDNVPFPLFPEAGGIYPFGGTDNGDSLFWLAAGSPSEWSIVVAESRAPEYEQFDMPTTVFLARLLRRDVVCRIFPEDFPLEPHSFSHDYNKGD